MGHQERPLPHTMVKFVVSRRAVELVDIHAIERDAAASGTENACIEWNATVDGADEVHLTCRVIMVVRLLAVWGDLLDGRTTLAVPSDEREDTLGILRSAHASGVAAVRAAKRWIEGS